MNTWGYFLRCQLGRLLFCGGISELHAAESGYYVVQWPRWKADPQGDGPESLGTSERSLGQSKDVSLLVDCSSSSHKGPAGSIPSTALTSMAVQACNRNSGGGGSRVSSTSSSAT